MMEKRPVKKIIHFDWSVFHTQKNKTFYDILGYKILIYIALFGWGWGAYKDELDKILRYFKTKNKFEIKRIKL